MKYFINSNYYLSKTFVAVTTTTIIITTIIKFIS